MPKIIVNEIGVPVVVEGEPRPWMPESFIEWLGPRLNKSLQVFEFGSGNSTLWLASRVQEITSVEHHILWREALRSIRPENATLLYSPMSYPQAIPDYGSWFDIIIIDGIERDACIHSAIAALSEDVVIVLDNSDSEAKEGQAWLREQGFSEKVFTGEYAWGKNGETHQTTVFYREGNCLGI